MKVSIDEIEDELYAGNFSILELEEIKQVVCTLIHDERAKKYEHE